MKYSENFRTKWHDTDSCHFLRPSAILMYMQETGNHQCRKYGMDLNDLYRNDGLGFLLSKIQARIYAPLFAYEDITVSTWCCESRGLSFLRCFEIKRGDETVAQALSTWALLDVKSSSLVKVSDFKREFPMDEMLDMSSLPPRVRIPSSVELEMCGKRKIVYSDIDFNGHMNNTKYPDMVCDFLPDMKDRWVSAFSLSYLKEGTYGNTLDVYRASVAADLGDEAYLVKTVRPDGATCLEAQINLSRKV